MSIGEKIEQNADIVKWCVHVLGPDDVMAAPSHAAAVAHAHALNTAVFRRVSTHEDVLCFAYAAPYPYSAEDHAEAVKGWLKSDD